MNEQQNTALDKIRKLMALANDPAANENEAAQALQFATALMMKHGIDEAEVNKVEYISVGYGSEFVAEHRWKRWSAAAAGKLYGSKPVRWGGKEMKFAGRDDNNEAAMMTYQWICRQIDHLYKQTLEAYAKTLGRKMEKADYRELRRTFKEAAANRVYNRVCKIVDDLTKNDALALQYVGSKALVVQTHRQNLDEEVNAFFAKSDIKTSKAVTRWKTGVGTRLGMQAGDKVQIQKAVQ